MHSYGQQEYHWCSETVGTPTATSHLTRADITARDKRFWHLDLILQSGNIEHFSEELKLKVLKSKP